jgi:hypothetical protein
MVRKTGIGFVVSVILSSTPAFAGDSWTQGPPNSTHWLHRLGPAGGWNPDGGGLCHWWERDCFTYPCAPDDYCRKPLPRVRCAPRPLCADHVHGHPSTGICPKCSGTH